MPEGDSRRVMLAVTVGTAVTLRIVHPLQQSAVERTPAAHIEHSGNPAHQAASP